MNNRIEFLLSSVPFPARQWLCRKIGWPENSPGYQVVVLIENCPLIHELNERILV